MPSPTYTLIQSTTLGSNAASIDFNTISQSYYDLRFHYSLRVTGAVNGADIKVYLNNDQSGYRNIIIYNDTTTNYRGYRVGDNNFNYATMIWGAGGNIPGANTTAGLFTNGRMLIPGYRNTTNLYRRSVGTETATVNVSAGAPSHLVMSSGQKSTGIAVNRVTFSLDAGYGLIAAGSTISLYGCTNS
jgi:hypothetical protein